MTQLDVHDSLKPSNLPLLPPQQKDCMCQAACRESYIQVIPVEHSRILLNCPLMQLSFCKHDLQGY